MLNDQIPEDFNEEEFKATQEFLGVLAKAVRAFKIYPANNPMYQKFINDLYKAFIDYFKTYDTLRLEIRQYELIFNGKVIYENTNRGDSIAFKFFIDGVRELNFLKDIEEKEIIDFLEIVGSENDPNSATDTVIQLWEKQFTHLEYSVIDDYSYEEKAQTQSNTRSKKDIEKALTEEINKEPEKILEKKTDKAFLNIYKISEGDVSFIREAMEANDKADVIYELIDILQSILEIENNPKYFSEIIEIIDQILEVLSSSEKFTHASKIIINLRNILRLRKDLTTEFIALINKSIDTAGDKVRLNIFAPLLEKMDPTLLNSFSDYLKTLNPNSIDSIIELLGEGKEVNVRKALCDVLTELGRENLSCLTTKLNDKRWFVVRNIIFVLGKIGDPAAISSLGALIKHKEPQVKKEIVYALSTIKDTKSYDLLAEFLKDSDSFIRILSIKILAGVQYKNILKTLLNMLSQKEFDEKTFEEKKAVFDALGEMSTDEIIPAIKQIMKKRWFFLEKKQFNENRLFAIQALKKLKTEMAIMVLKENKKKGKKPIRDACVKALYELGIR